MMLTFALCNFIATLLFYRAFEIGTLSLVSPIAPGFAVVTALLALLNGERPALPALGGTLLLIAGVIIVTSTPEKQEQSSLAGVPEALGAALCYGTIFWALDFVTPALGRFWPLLIFRITILCGVLLTLVLANGRHVSQTRAEHRPTALLRGSAPRMVWLAALAAAVVDSLAWVAFMEGTRSEHTAIVTALASLFSAVTVLLAWSVLRERLTSTQWAGVAIILLGVLLVSL
jgi:drug/metabolite transporter (DMT)-like permease